MIAFAAKFVAVSRIGFHKASAYLIDLVARTVFLGILLFIFFNLYRHALPEGGALEGYDLVRVVWYIVFTEAVVLGGPRLQGVMDEEVKSGQWVVVLTRPIGYLTFHLAQFLGEALVSVPLFLATGAAVASVLVGVPPFAIQFLPGLAVLLTLALTLHFFISASMALTSFWIQDSTPFFWIYQKVLFLFGGLMFPLELYPDWVREIALALPFSRVLHGPASWAMRPSWESFLNLAGMQLAWILVLGALAQTMCRIGLRRLEAQGG